MVTGTLIDAPDLLAPLQECFWNLREPLVQELNRDPVPGMSSEQIEGITAWLLEFVEDMKEAIDVYSKEGLEELEYGELQQIATQARESTVRLSMIINEHHLPFGGSDSLGKVQGLSKSSQTDETNRKLAEVTEFLRTFGESRWLGAVVTRGFHTKLDSVVQLLLSLQSPRKVSAPKADPSWALPNTSSLCSSCSSLLCGKICLACDKCEHGVDVKALNARSDEASEPPHMSTSEGSAPSVRSWSDTMLGATGQTLGLVSPDANPIAASGLAPEVGTPPMPVIDGASPSSPSSRRASAAGTAPSSSPVSRRASDAGSPSSRRASAESPSLISIPEGNEEEEEEKTPQPQPDKKEDDATAADATAADTPGLQSDTTSDQSPVPGTNNVEPIVLFPTPESARRPSTIPGSAANEKQKEDVFRVGGCKHGCVSFTCTFCKAAKRTMNEVCTSCKKCVHGIQESKFEWCPHGCKAVVSPLWEMYKSIPSDDSSSSGRLTRLASLADCFAAAAHKCAEERARAAEDLENKISVLKDFAAALEKIPSVLRHLVLLRIGPVENVASLKRWMTYSQTISTLRQLRTVRSDAIAERMLRDFPADSSDASRVDKASRKSKRRQNLDEETSAGLEELLANELQEAEIEEDNEEDEEGRLTDEEDSKRGSRPTTSLSDAEQIQLMSDLGLLAEEKKEEEEEELEGKKKKKKKKKKEEKEEIVEDSLFTRAQKMKSLLCVGRKSIMMRPSMISQELPDESPRDGKRRALLQHSSTMPANLGSIEVDEENIPENKKGKIKSAKSVAFSDDTPEDDGEHLATEFVTKTMLERMAFPGGVYPVLSAVVLASDVPVIAAMRLQLNETLDILAVGSYRTVDLRKCKGVVAGADPCKITIEIDPQDSFILKFETAPLAKHFVCSIQLVIDSVSVDKDDEGFTIGEEEQIKGSLWKIVDDADVTAGVENLASSNFREREFILRSKSLSYRSVALAQNQGSSRRSMRCKEIVVDVDSSGITINEHRRPIYILENGALRTLFLLHIRYTSAQEKNQVKLSLGAPNMKCRDAWVEQLNNVKLGEDA